MNHYVMEPAVCTPAAGWRKVRLARQVQDIRLALLLNGWVNFKCLLTHQSCLHVNPSVNIFIVAWLIINMYLHKTLHKVILHVIVN
ncbi:MAG: hypothetical protein COB36_15020 [Alphaproteobacteria bacterium]|nr:MAG: hypothetical protein COB36_15020 [Alphaproteobacteria bacterium]